MRILFLSVLLLILLGGCASNIPLEIRQDITESPVSIDAVSQDIDQYQGRQVRWGGTIVSVENKRDETWIEVVGKSLDSWGEPVYSDKSEGRFLARIDGFLDPAIYKAERSITVFGTVENKASVQIDDYLYTYPLIKAQSHYLWRDYNNQYYVYPDPYYPYYYPYRYGLNFGYGHGFFPRHGYFPRYGYGVYPYYYWY